MSRLARTVCAAACVVVGAAAMAAFAGFVLLLGLDVQPPLPLRLVAFPWALAWNELLIALFAVQHSGMARQAFKRWWLRVVPPPLERATYVAASGGVLMVVVVCWQPMFPDAAPLWRLPSLLSLVSIAGAGGILLLSPYLAPLRFLGLQQAWTGKADDTEDVLRVVGPYRFVRHPLMACLLVFLWGHAVMPLDLFVLSGSLTGYVVIGTVLEERDLRRRFGAAYRDYAARVPAVIPWKPPALRSVHPPVRGGGPGAEHSWAGRS